MSKVGLDSLGYFDYNNTLLTQFGMFHFTFTPFVTIPQLVIEFFLPFALEHQTSMMPTRTIA